MPVSFYFYFLLKDVCIGQYYSFICMVPVYFLTILTELHRKCKSWSLLKFSLLFSLNYPCLRNFFCRLVAFLFMLTKTTLCIMLNYWFVVCWSRQLCCVFLTDTYSKWNSTSLCFMEQRRCLHCLWWWRWPFKGYFLLEKCYNFLQT